MHQGWREFQAVGIPKRPCRCSQSMRDSSWVVRQAGPARCQLVGSLRMQLAPPLPTRPPAHLRLAVGARGAFLVALAAHHAGVIHGLHSRFQV